MQTLAIKPRGLQTHPNQLSIVEPGAMTYAKNSVLDRDGVVEIRRGLKQYGTQLSFGSTKKMNAFFEFVNTLLVSYDNKIARDSDGAGTWVDYAGTFSPPTGASVIRSLQANKNFYIATDSGIKKLESPSSAFATAGMVKALDGTGATTGASGWMTNNTQVAYRVVWGIKDANANLILGAPSQRIIVVNSAGGTRNVAVIFTIPSGITTSHFFQVYRSVMSSGVAVDPNDELALVYEASPTAGSFTSYSKTFLDAAVNTGTDTITITAHGFVNGDAVVFSNSGGALPTGLTAGTTYYIVGATANTFQVSATFGGAAVDITAAAGGGTHTIQGAQSLQFTDITPENLRGAALYTNPSQQGILQANEQPPLCRDMVSFKGHALYVNTVSKQRFFLTLVSVGGTGLAVADTITIGGVVYTGAAAEVPATGTFLVDTAGTAADNIENTALSLVRVINKYASNTAYYAYYISGFNDLPGQILLEERSIGGASFAVISSRGNAWNPVLPSSGTTQSSTNQTNKNGIYISKSLQPEAVPTTNILFAGSADKDARRVIALRDSVFIFKDDGIYRLVGDSVSNFSVSLFDETVRLRGDETAVAFNNQAFCFSNQGVIAVSETGVAVVSRPIESDLFVLAALSTFEAQSFAIAYESDRKYILFTVAESSDVFAVQAFVFNVFTNAWTGPWPMNRSCGLVKRADDKLYLGSWDQNGPYARYVRQERKAFTVDDYADEDFTITVVSSSGTTITVASTTNLQVNDKIKQGAKVAIITEVTDATHIEVDRERAWTAGDATVYRSISVDMQFVPEHAKNPGILKHFTEGTLMFERAQFKSISISFSSNFSPSYEDTTATAKKQGVWGFFPWNGLPWGGGFPLFQPIRMLLPRRKQRASWVNLRLQHTEALSRFAYGGISLQFEPMSERFA